jgi:lipoprotein signal peptidase
MLYAIVAVLVILADQLIKLYVSADSFRPMELIPGVLNMTKVENTGGAFGLLGGEIPTYWFIIIAGVFTVLVVIALATRFVNGWLARWSLVLVTAGGISNCIDRVINVRPTGHVVDMFQFAFWKSFPVFNLADIFISVFCIVFILAILFGRDQKDQGAEDDEFVEDEELDEEPEEEPDEKNVYEEEGSGSRKWQTAAVALLVGLGAGYLLGNYFPMNGGQPVETLPPSVETPKVVAKDTLAIDSTVAKTAAPEGVQPADAVAEKAEEPKTDVTTEAGKNNEAVKQTEASTVAPKASETKPAAKPAETKPAAPVAEENDKYAAMDARVRTGAYRIVGTERVMKVKEGDNLRRIAQRTLGPDMECYIEVYNGLTAVSPLKVGQEIKIPKLQLKKKKTQAAN